MSALQLRAIVHNDLDALTELFVECFNRPPWNDGWSHEAARDRLDAIIAGRYFRGYVAVGKAGLAGMLMGQKERWVQHYHFALQEMCVRPSSWRTGVGTDLFRHAVDELRAEGVEKVYVITSPGDAAEAFYAKLGFYKSRGRIVMALPFQS
jgi:ribosomal protein S18 acetylase RimI-like enzyme